MLDDDLNHVLAHTTAVWDEFRGARLFITGGTGFFGKWLLESFAWANARRELDARAVVLTRNVAAFRASAPRLAGQPGVELYEGDVRDFAFPGGRFTHVIHAATPSSAAMNEDAPEMMLDQIIQGTRRVFDFARAADAAKVLYTSSGAVYGRQPADVARLTEDYAGAPDHLDIRWAYGEGKRVAEQLCAIYHRRHGLDVKIARCFAFVGPYLPLDGHFAVGNFLRDGLRGGPVRVGGDGTPQRSYLYAADLVIWLWTLLAKAPPCRPYNVGSDAGLTVGELARKIAAYFRTDVHFARQAVQGMTADRYVPSTERARQELGLRTLVPLDEAIDRTVRWHRGHERRPTATV
jgi:dTDP-glucose 4,6-dehydratase